MHTTFHKMNGLGNDFVVLGLDEPLPTHAVESHVLSHVERIANRTHGIGCDQVIVLRTARDNDVVRDVSIFNADGSLAEACGNAMRCVTGWLLAHGHGTAIHGNTPSEPKPWSIALRVGDHTVYARWKHHPAQSGALSEDVTVDMGKASWDVNDVGVAETFSHTALRDHVETLLGDLPHPPSLVSIKNPHLVVWVRDPEAVDLTHVGRALETSPMFTNGVNVSFATLRASDSDAETIADVRVWERGAGITQACGTAACATAAVTWRHWNDLSQAYGVSSGSSTCEAPRVVSVRLPGGTLHLERSNADHLWMSGPWQHDFAGTVALAPLPFTWRSEHTPSTAEPKHHEFIAASL